MPLSELLKKWLFTVDKVSIAPRTFEKEECDYRLYILTDEISNYFIKDIGPMVIQNFYNRLNLNKKCSYNKILSVHKLLRKFFFYLVDIELAAKNPCTNKQVKIPNSYETKNQMNTNDRRILKPEEWLRIVDMLTGTYAALFPLILGTGGRFGEILGLSETRIDLSKNSVRFDRALKRIKVYNNDGTSYCRKTILGPVKTRSSNRETFFPDALNPILKKHIAQEKEKHLKLGIPYDPDGLIFTSETCTALDQKNVLRTWQRILKRADVPYINIHGLRHSFVSMLAQNGTRTKVISNLVGHSSTTITENIYMHLWPEDKSEEVNKLNFLFKN